MITTGEWSALLMGFLIGGGTVALFLNGVMDRAIGIRVRETIDAVLREIIRDYGVWAKANNSLNNAFETLGEQVNDHNIAIARCVAYIEKQEQK